MLINYIMKNDYQPKYVKCTYQIFIYSITFQNNYKLHFRSDKSANQYGFPSQTTTKMSRCFELNAVDIIYEDQRASDTIVILDFYSNEISSASVTFDLKKEKFIKQENKTLFRKTLNGRLGYIDYKFVAAATQIISYQQFTQLHERRNKIVLRKNQDYETIRRQNIENEIIKKQKDKLIGTLQAKMETLLHQNVELNRKIAEQAQKLKNPLSIRVNIQSKNQGGKRSSEQLNLERLLHEKQQLREQNNSLSQKIVKIEIQNKKLNQNCKILIEQLKGVESVGSLKVKEIEKKLSQVDSGYLLTKTISNYDKAFKKNLDLEQNIKQIHELLQNSKEKTEKEEMLSSGKSAKYHKSIQDMVNSKHSAEIKKELKQSKMGNQIKGLMKQSLFSRSGREGKQEAAIGQLYRKQKQIQILQNQLLKKQAYIEKLLLKQHQYEKKYQQYQQQKSNLISNLAISSLGTGKGTSQQMAGIKQLSLYNNQLVKEKQRMVEEIKQLKTQNNQKSKKIETFEITTRKSLIFMSHVSKQKQNLQQKLKELSQGQKAIQTKILAEKGEQYQSLKQQFIQCSQELDIVKLQSNQMKQTGIRLREQNALIGKQVEVLRLQKQRLEMIAEQASSYQQQIKVLEQRYEQIQRLQKGIKNFVLRLQSQMNLVNKKKDEQIYQSEMRSLLKETYNKINQFQHDYYQTLIEATKISEESVEKYYDSLAKYEESAAMNSLKKQQQMWNKRIQLLQQRQAMLKPIKQKRQNYVSKQQKKLLMIQDQFQSFMDCFKKFNLRLNELQAYKINLKDMLQNGKFMPINVIDNQNSSISSINEKDRPITSVTGPQPLKTSFLAKSMVKSRTDQNAKIDEYEKQSDDEGVIKKTIFVKEAERGISDLKDFRAQSRQLFNSRISKMQDDNVRLKESLTQNLSMREELAREKLELKKKETRLIQAHNQKIREIQKQAMLQKTEKQNLLIKLRQCEAQLERSSKLATAELQSSKKICQKQLNEVIRERQQLKNEVASLQELLENAGSQLAILSNDDRIKEKQIVQLMDEQASLLKRLATYEETENFLLQQLKAVKQVQDANQQQVSRLLEERSEKFVKIEKLKGSEIQRLRGIIQQLYQRVETEVNDNLRHKDIIQQLKQEIIEREKSAIEQKESAQLVIDSLEKELANQREVRETIQDQNKQYHSHIIQLSDSVVAHQKQILRLNIIIDSHEKEKKMLQEISTKLGQKQAGMKQEAQKLQVSLKQKNQEIRKLQIDFQKIDHEVNLLSKELESLKKQTASLKEERERLKDMIFLKQRQILAIDKQKGLALIGAEKLKVEIDSLSSQLIIQETKIRDLMTQNEKLAQQFKVSPSKNSERLLEKSKRDILMASKIQSKDIKDRDEAATNLMRKIPQLSMSITSTTRGITELNRSEKGQKGRTLAVPVMKHNKMLNLPSVDSDPVAEDEFNLQIIQQRHDELNDTFFNGENQNIDIVVNNQDNKMIEHQKASIGRPNVVDQSGIHIQLPEQESGDYTREVPVTFAHIEGQHGKSNNAELINEIVRLKRLISDLQNRQDSSLSYTAKGRQAINKSQKSQFSSNGVESVRLLKPEKSFKIQRQLSKDAESVYQNLFEDRTKELQQEVSDLKEELRSVKQKNSNNQIYIVEVEQKLRVAQKSLIEEEKNVEQLMIELKRVSELNCIIEAQAEKQKKETNNLINRFNEQLKRSEDKLEELATQSLKKDSIIYDLELNLGRDKQALQKIVGEMSISVQITKKAQLQARQAEEKLKKQVKSFRVYEEQAEIEMLHLRQDVDKLKRQVKLKEEELVEMGQRYLQMQSTNKSLLLDLKQQELYCDQSQQTNIKLQQKFQSVRGEMEGNEHYRKNMLKKMKQLEIQNIKLNEKLSQLTKQANIESQKWIIRLKAQQDAQNSYQERLKQKQLLITELKHQIGIYNDECDSLKKENQNLNIELEKLQRQLKEIMVQYEQQLKMVNKRIQGRATATSQLTSNLRILENQLEARNKQVRDLKNEIKTITSQNTDLQNKLQNLRAKSKTTNFDIQNKLESKIDQCQRLNSGLKSMEQRLKQANNRAQSAQLEIQSQSANSNQKISKIQLQNEQLKEKVEELMKRPTQAKLVQYQHTLQGLEKQLERVKEMLQAQRHKNQNRVQNSEAYQVSFYEIQLVNLSNLIRQQRKKQQALHQELKQVIKSFKKQQNDYNLLKQKSNRYKSANNSLANTIKNLQTKVKELHMNNKALQLQNQELQREIWNARISRIESFTKSNADTTIK